MTGRGFGVTFSRVRRSAATLLVPLALALAPSAGLGQERLTAVRAHTFDHLGQRISVFDLEADGLPVFLRKGAVRTDAAGTVRRAMIDVPDLRGAPLPPRDPDAEVAAATARAEAGGVEPVHAAAGWLVGRGGTLVPVVRVEQGGPPGDDPLAVFYAAGSLVPVHEEPVFETATAGGFAFAENPVTTPEPGAVTLFGLDEPADLLNGAFARVYRCVDREECAVAGQTARPNKQGDFVYLPDLGENTFDDPFSEVNLYHHLTRFSAWMRVALGWDGRFGGERWIRASVGLDWYNAAYYSGNDDTAPSLIFGQDVVDMAYDADVVFHEFGHAVNRTLRTHPWYVRDAHGLDVSPMGIEEGIADAWAQTFAGDPVMDTYVSLSRTADNDLTCPADVVGEGHYEGRIVSGFAWDVRERIGAEAWNHVLYRALPFVASEAGFDDLVAALAASADDLAAEGAPFADAGQSGIILEAAAARGLLDAECAARLVPLADGERKLVYGFGRKRTGKRDRPFGVQWVLTAGEGDAAFRLVIDPIKSTDGSFGWRAHVSRGDPLAVTWIDPETVPEGEPEFTVDADLTIEGTPAHVDFPREGMAPLAPGEKVYVLLSADVDAQSMKLEVMPFFLPSLPPAAGDAGPAGPGAEVSAHASPWGCAAVRPGDRAGSGLLRALLG